MVKRGTGVPWTSFLALVVCAVFFAANTGWLLRFDNVAALILGALMACGGLYHAWRLITWRTRRGSEAPVTSAAPSDRKALVAFGLNLIFVMAMVAWALRAQGRI